MFLTWARGVTTLGKSWTNCEKPVYCHFLSLTTGRPAVFLRCFRHGGKCPFCSEALQRPLHTFVSSQRTAVTAENILICEVAVYFLLCSPKNKLLVTLTVLLSDMGQMPSVQCQFCRHGHVQELYEWCLLRPFFHVLHQKSKYVASCVCAS